MDFKEIKGQRHYLYDSKEEFYALSEKEMPVRRNWREGSEDEWVFTDDNHVCQILKCFKVGRNDCVRTVCGTFSRKNKKNKMLGENGIAENIYAFSGTNMSKERFNSKKRTSKELLFARYVAWGEDSNKPTRKSTLLRSMRTILSKNQVFY